jgi:hypothetical protein
MQKKSKNIAHAQDGIKLKKLNNSGRLRNSPTTGTKVETPDTAKELPTDYRASARPYQVFRRLAAAQLGVRKNRAPAG